MNETETNRDSEVLLKLSKPKTFYVMFILYILYFLDYVCRSIISPLYPYLKADLHLNDAQLGMLSTVVLAMICILGLPISYLIDRYSRGRLISGLAIIWSMGSLFSGIAVNYGQIFASRAIIGFGESSFASGGSAMISAIYKRTKRATAISIWNTSIALGTAFAMLVGANLAKSIGWRHTLIYLSIPSIIFGILAFFLPDYKNVKKKAGKVIKECTIGFTLKSFLKNTTLLKLFIATGMTAFLMNAVMSWLPSYFNRYMGVDTGFAGTLSAGLFLMALVAGPLGGILSDRWTRKKINGRLNLCSLVSFATAAALITGFLFKIMPCIVLGIFLISVAPSSQITALQESVPAFHRVTVYGAYLMAQYLLGGLWGPYVTGLFSDAFQLNIALVIAALIGLVGALFYFLSSRTFEKDHQKAKDMERIIYDNDFSCMES